MYNSEREEHLTDLPPHQMGVLHKDIFIYLKNAKRK